MARIEINTDYNTSLPNSVLYDSRLWNNSEGKPLSAAYLRVYLMFIDKVTQTYDDEDGSKVGVVLGGAPIPYSAIKDALGCSYPTVQRVIQHLADARLILRQLVSLRDGYRYFVVDCRKEFKVKELKTRDGRTIDPIKYHRVKPKAQVAETTPARFEDVGMYDHFTLDRTGELMVHCDYCDYTIRGEPHTLDDGTPSCRVDANELRKHLSQKHPEKLQSDVEAKKSDSTASFNWEDHYTPNPPGEEPGARCKYCDFSVGRYFECGALRSHMEMEHPDELDGVEDEDGPDTMSDYHRDDSSEPPDEVPPEWAA